MPTVVLRRDASKRRLAGSLAFAFLLWLTAAGTADAARKAPLCFGKKATIVSSKRVVTGTSSSDVIVIVGKATRKVDGLGGNDRICGGRGGEILIGGNGIDLIHGGGGDDQIFGGNGSDRLLGGGGDDELQGEKGSDRLEGGPGDDRLYGGKGNDRLSGDGGDDLLDAAQGDDLLKGGAGADTLIGGNGSDHLSGDGGDDTLRGDGGSDAIDGGPGRDILSFASSPAAIQVNLKLGYAQKTGDGNKRIKGIEDLVGSAFPDILIGDGGPNRIDGGPGYDRMWGNGGYDTAYGGPDGAACEEFAVEHNCGIERFPSRGVAVLINRGLDGASLVIKGDDADNRITISYEGGGYVVRDNGPSGLYVGRAGDYGCQADGRGANLITVAFCPIGRGLNFILATGGKGNDTIAVGAGVPAGVSFRANGGEGSDHLVGGPGDDVLEAGSEFRSRSEGGPTRGADRLEGNGGHDTLIADPGGDRMYGGPGNDLLVSSATICQGHVFAGGAGVDTASYSRIDGARDGYSGKMKMQIGKPSGPVSGCGDLDKMGADIESLEGSRLDDILIGDGRANGFLGWSGADSFYGRGGGDYIDANDGERDRLIDCGGGKATVIADSRDPAPRRCR